MITIFDEDAIAEAKRHFINQDTIMLFGQPYYIQSMKVESKRLSKMSVLGEITRGAFTKDIATIELVPFQG